jgi:C-methyltransferase
MNAVFVACGGLYAAALAAAARLGIADRLASGPLSVAELAALTGTQAAPLGDLLRLLAGVGVFAEQADGRFSNSPDSEPLETAHPNSQRHLCRLLGEHYQPVFTALGHTLETGESACDLVLGSDLYRYLARHPDARRVYDLAMADLARPIGPLLAAALDFSAVRRVIDIGGGGGMLLRGLLGCHGHLQGVCVDLPEVCARAAADLAAADAGLVGRLRFVAGDLFTPLSVSGEVYLLKNVLHNWGDADCRRILTAQARTLAATAGQAPARLLVIEALTDGTLAPAYQAVDALLQRVLCRPGARARGLDHLRTLITDAGLAVAQVHALASGHTLVVCDLLDASARGQR